MKTAIPSRTGHGDTMERLHIPQQHERGLVLLKQLPEESFHELVDALAKSSPVFDPGALIRHLASSVKTIQGGDLNDVIETVVSLLRVQSYLDLSTTDLVKSLCETMTKSNREHLKLSGEECDIFQERLSTLFAIESLTYPAKTSEITSDHDHIFVRARVVSDIRTIFGPDTEQLPKGAAIIHMLSIAYHQSGQTEKFYVAMDAQDIRSFISVLQRALSKEANLKKLLDVAKIIHIEET
jgi:hypothetical protein